MRPNLVPLLAAAAALVAVPTALAHGPGEKAVPGYSSKVLSISPAMPGLQASVEDGDEELELVNSTGKTILVYGYAHEPYLRIGPNGIFENRLSPATYLNQDRFGKTKLPAHVSPKAAPQWRRVASGTTYSWHDHRIHWMSPIPPPAVQKDKGKPSHIFDWKVQATADGKPIAISGTLDWVPPAGKGMSATVKALIGVGAAAALAVLAFLGVRLRRRPAASPSIE
jgi:hypothetical protein